MLTKWLREPLLHFLLIGAVLFFIYGLQNEGISDNNYRIVISEADINRLIALWRKKWQRSPTQDELNGLIEQQIHEEVLYREALAMGLDQNDAIVRRRLAQKVEFISADLATLVEPAEKDLADYLTAHADKFEVAGRISFMQVYLSSDRRKHAQQDAQRLLSELTQTGAKIDVSTAGDPFMFGLKHEYLTMKGVSRLFGESFANKLFTLPSGGWQGPIQSAYGSHLVRIDKKTEPRQPQLDEVREKVRSEWFAQQRRTVDKAFYQGLRQRYEIVINNPDIKDLVVSAKQ